MIIAGSPNRSWKVPHSCMDQSIKAGIRRKPLSVLCFTGDWTAQEQETDRGRMTKRFSRAALAFVPAASCRCPPVSAGSVVSILANQPANYTNCGRCLCTALPADQAPAVCQYRHRPGSWAPALLGPARSRCRIIAFNSSVIKSQKYPQSPHSKWSVWNACI